MSAMAEDIAIDTNDVEWTDFGNGIAFKVLRLSEETGTWTVLFQCQPGSSFAPHLHLAAGEYFVTTGHMEYRAGSARSGGYGYEPRGVFHEETNFPEYTELYFTNFGPIAFVDDDKNVISVLDVNFFQQALEQKAAA